MSMRLQMLQVARLAPMTLGDSADLVVQFVESKMHASGAFVDRADAPDLYYTVFGLGCLTALQRDPPRKRVAAYLATFGDGDGLDLIHRCCLARCWAEIGERPPRGLVEHVTQHEPSSAYEAFMLLGARQDAGVDPPACEALIDALATGDGGYANDAAMKIANTPATAAAVTVRHALGLSNSPRSATWLLERCHADGGFFAMDGAPMPDLLSTAVALHALSAMHADINAVREPCLGFIDTLWSPRGAFYGNWAEEDEALDVEYTWYALLALGHLSV